MQEMRAAVGDHLPDARRGQVTQRGPDEMPETAA